MLSCRQALFFSLAALVVLIFLLTNYSDVQPSTYIPKLPTAHKEEGANSVEADFAKVCSDHHSILYKDVERTEAYWRKVGGMTWDDLELSRYICERDGNCPIIKLYNGQLYIRQPISHDLSYQSRGHSMLLMLSRVDLSDSPNVDFLFNTNDGVRVYEPCFIEMDKHISEAESQSRNESINHFLFPDFTAFDWWEARLPGFNEVRMNFARSSGSFANKIAKLFWRGSVSLQQGTQRSDLVNILSDKTDVADVALITSKDFTSKKGANSNLKSLQEMCKYQYIIYTEGIAYSGRLKYTALCNSVQIGHQITFIEFWTHLLEPYYVSVSDWNDALDKYHALQANPAEAERLAVGAAEAVRKHLSSTAINCYIKRMLTGYARSTNWPVMSPAEDTVGRNGTGAMVDAFSWVPLEHFLARMTYIGTKEASQNSTSPIVWTW